MNAEEMREEFAKRVNTSTNRLLENYRTLIQSSHVGNESAGHDQLQMETAAANIVFACESLLDQVQELRMHVILQDMPSIVNEVREERQDLEKRLDSAVND